MPNLHQFIRHDNIKKKNSEKCLFFYLRRVEVKIHTPYYLNNHTKQFYEYEKKMACYNLCSQIKIAQLHFIYTLEEQLFVVRSLKVRYFSGSLISRAGGSTFRY